MLLDGDINPKKTARRMRLKRLLRREGRYLEAALKELKADIAQNNRPIYGDGWYIVDAYLLIEQEKRKEKEKLFELQLRHIQETLDVL